MLTCNANCSLKAPTRLLTAPGPTHPVAGAAGLDRAVCAVLEPDSKLRAQVIQAEHAAERKHNPAAYLAVTWGGGSRWLGGAALLMQPAL